MVVLSRCLPLLVAALPFALASSNVETDKIENIRPGQKVLHMDFGKLRGSLRARPSKSRPEDDPSDAGPWDVPICPSGHPCIQNCLCDHLRRPAPLDSYHQLCGVVGCSAEKGAPLCPVGKCDGGCICREEIWTKLNVLLINDALVELQERDAETSKKDEL